MSTREQKLSQVLNQVFALLQKLKIDGEQSEMFTEIKKGVAFVNNELVQPEVPVNGVHTESPNAP